MFARCRQFLYVIFCLMLVVGVVHQVHAQAAQESSATGTSLKRLSLEELGNIEVTTVNKEPVKVTRTPAAVYVITQEDIRRSGAANILFCSVLLSFSTCPSRFVTWVSTQT